jgi:DNA-binding CsgD family transcriptional regulator
MVPAATALANGRAAYARAEWHDAYALLTQVDGVDALGPEDLELLARSAYMLGRDDEYVSALERAHRAYLGAGRVPAAVRCTWWIGHSHLFRGRPARAEGWFGVGERLLGSTDRDCVESGYVLIPVWLRQMSTGDWEAGHSTASEAAAIGERFGDADLTWLARDEQSRALVKMGKVDEAMRLADELLVVVGSGSLSPVVTGIVYCNTIDFCLDAAELRHVREWTQGLSGWCADRPQMLAHLGFCLVHVAEIMQLRGDLREALQEARLAAEIYTRGALNQIAVGKALYRQGEVHRIQGRLREAEECYRAASRGGCEPVPGLALLRLAQGAGSAAASLMRRAVTEQVDPLQRARLLPAYVEVMLAEGDVDAARAASAQLEDIVNRWNTDGLQANAALSRGRVAQASGKHETALRAGRRAWQLWQELDLPFEAARARLLVAEACRSLGDEECATLEAEAARDVLTRVGSVSDLVAVNTLLGRKASVPLSDRELEVLRLVAAGRSNKEIADALVISPHTVARHLQNIYVKIGVPSRTSATAYAFEHALV